MTSATLIYYPHLNEIPPQKRGVTGAPYITTIGSFSFAKPISHVFAIITTYYLKFKICHLNNFYAGICLQTL